MAHLSAHYRRVNDFVQLFPAVRVVVTCRKAGWAGGLENDFEFFSTLPLDFRQQTTFVTKWYAAVRHVTQFELTQAERAQHAITEADRLIDLLVKDGLREVASNPLILSLICLVHWQRRDLPRGRTALYGECLQILLDLWDHIDKTRAKHVPHSTKNGACSGKSLIECTPVACGRSTGHSSHSGFSNFSRYPDTRRRIAARQTDRNSQRRSFPTRD